ncbi:MAG: hypothetical protein AAF642_01400 [Pseudomonadota bacterium]
MTQTGKSKTGTLNKSGVSLYDVSRVRLERLWPIADDGDPVIIISGDKSPLTCDLINGNRFELKPEKDPRGHMYALLVESQLANNILGRIRLSDKDLS